MIQNVTAHTRLATTTQVPNYIDKYKYKRASTFECKFSKFSEFCQYIP